MICKDTHRIASGRKLSESRDDGIWKIRFENHGKVYILNAYALSQLESPGDVNVYNEISLRDGHDLPGGKLLAEGEPSYADVQRLLPPITDKAYCFLSGAASWGGVLIDRQGRIFPQDGRDLLQSEPLFSPAMMDDELGKQPPGQFLLDGKYPILFSVHFKGTRILEFLYFVNAGDPDRDPVVWIRAKHYEKEASQSCSVEYHIAALSRHSGRPVEEETFLTALADTIAYWLRFEDAAARLEIPEKKLQNTVYGTLMACATTFTGDHAHYGHLWYGAGIHDNFPPNYIWTLETCCLFGQLSWAKRILQHLLIYVVNREGRFEYRQGKHEQFGASAEEYGQILFIIDRYSLLLDSAHWPEEYYEALSGMGNILLENCVPCQEYGGRILVRMCAEADTNTRVHVYLNNNLWAVRGFQALARIFSQKGSAETSKHFGEMAKILLSNTLSVANSLAESSDYGMLVPFRFGYTAKPLTLSNCETTSRPVDEETLQKYLIPSDMRNSQGSDQDLTENTYANYRYYPEILSSMLLDHAQAEALVRMRESIGGEFLGMTRFYSWLDDWPVAHYARYLLESERIEKYLLLLYAHTAHHGNPDLMCYYEQVTANGSVVAPDCVPSLLTTALLTAWMFAYETVENGCLHLLSAIPKAWFSLGFSADGLCYSGGACSINWDGKHLALSFSSPVHTQVEIVWRLKKILTPEDITAGFESVERINQNHIILKQGVKEAVFEIR